MNKKLSLNRNQLKLIAIISMVIDHTAWGFLDFYSPLGYFLHICGRLTVPIMCFFIAEGFRKTHDLKRYINRMAVYAVITIIPFYLFFHEEYDYRQNIIFDLLLGLLMLTVLESKLRKSFKVLLAILIFAVSMTIGGWVIEPILFILAFYYGRDFKEKAKWFIIADVAMVVLLMILIAINQFVYKFTGYDWVWWDKLYLLGFMLALPLLKCYNGEKGKDILGRYFFYVFYPSHFVVLYLIKLIFVEGITAFQIYSGLHVLALALAVILASLSLRARPSKGQNAIVLFIAFAALYIFGFVLEIFAKTADGYYLACCVQYLGEYMALITAMFFVSYMCRITLPSWLLALHVFVASVFMYLLIQNEKTHFFYKSIGVNLDGPFQRPEIVHNTGFFLSMFFIFIICAEIVYMCVHSMKVGTALDAKRSRLLLYSILCSWLPYIMTIAGLTGGYEIPALGLMFVSVWLYLTFIKYGALDSVQLASENALDHGHEGIIVLDNIYHIAYHNSMVDRILGDFPHDKDVREWKTMADILDGTCKSINIDGRIYDFEVEPLIERKYEQGKMIWIIDNTEHYESMDKITENAHRDALTGLYNRTYFKELVDKDIKEGRVGTFIMMDMDNFKQVNDRFGHQRGDTVLCSLAGILAEYTDEKLIACRVGGDEFCAYIRDEADREVIVGMANDIISKFIKGFRDGNDGCTLSMGIAFNNKKDNGPELLECSALYALADKKLYEAKGSGKNKYCI